MIFATVGTQLPFPRLIGALDEIARTTGLHIVAQTGDPACSATSLETHVKLSPALFEALFSRAEVIVAHAGIGSIISAQRHQKPIILFPRLASLGEHRNEHQIATVKQVADRIGVYAASTADDIERLILDRSSLKPAFAESPSKRKLIDAIAGFIEKV